MQNVTNRQFKLYLRRFYNTVHLQVLVEVHAPTSYYYTEHKEIAQQQIKRSIVDGYQGFWERWPILTWKTTTLPSSACRQKVQVEEMKLWAELMMSLHQLDTASITDTGLGRWAMAFSYRKRQDSQHQKATNKFSGNWIKGTFHKSFKQVQQFLKQGYVSQLRQQLTWLEPCWYEPGVCKHCHEVVQFELQLPNCGQKLNSRDFIDVYYWCPNQLV